MWSGAAVVRQLVRSPPSIVVHPGLARARARRLSRTAWQVPERVPGNESVRKPRKPRACKQIVVVVNNFPTRCTTRDFSRVFPRRTRRVDCVPAKLGEPARDAMVTVPPIGSETSSWLKIVARLPRFVRKTQVWMRTWSDDAIAGQRCQPRSPVMPPRRHTHNVSKTGRLRQRNPTTRASRAD